MLKERADHVNANAVEMGAGRGRGKTECSALWSGWEPNWTVGLPDGRDWAKGGSGPKTDRIA